MTLLIITVVVVWFAQRLLAVHQAMRFRRQYAALRRDGRAVAVGAAKRFGRRVYVALAADHDGTIAESMVFRGITVFAGGRSEPQLTGARVGRLASGRAPDGMDPLVAEAAGQAAGFLSAADNRAADKRSANKRSADKRSADKRKVRAAARA